MSDKAYYLASMFVANRKTSKLSLRELLHDILQHITYSNETIVMHSSMIILAK